MESYSMQHEGVKQEDSKMHENSDKLDNDSLMMGADDDIANEITSMNSDCHHRIQWSDCLPTEIIIHIFKYLDCTSLTKVAMTNAFWYSLFNSEDIQLAFKNECKSIFKLSGLYTASRKYANQFLDWKHMFIFRPRVRFDGIYTCKAKYWHDGLAEFGDVKPLHMVTYFIYIHFEADGSILYCQETYELERFVEKAKRNKVKFDKGIYYINDNLIKIEITKGKNTFCYTYKMEGEMMKQSDSFELISKNIVDVEMQSFTPIRQTHKNSMFEFVKLKFKF